MKKETLVRLRDRITGKEREFPFSQAECLLNMSDCGGFELIDSDFTFKANELIRKPNKGKAEKTA